VKFTVDERVRLPANKKEGWGEEFGTVEAYEGGSMYIVRVDQKFRHQGDDGIRELHVSRMWKVD